MKTVTICKGLPASGKTTWAKEQLDKAPANSIKRINKDDMRAMLDGKWTKGGEKLVLAARDFLIMQALDMGHHVIVDDTNLHPSHIKDITRMVRDRNDNVTVKIKDFTDVSYEECIKRNNERGGDVPNEAITRMYNDFLKDKAQKFKAKEHDHNKKTVIMCDLDGTLALMGDRSPYDASTCADDEVNKPVDKVLDMWESNMKNQTVMLSGRSDKYREQTLDFLVKLGYQREDADKWLFMRKEGDFRKDSIVKEELYRTHVEPKYNVLFVLDDRNQVVDMWRSIGLTCFQVAEGNF